jgi:hypothetical protein
MKYKITFKNHLKSLEFLISGTFLFGGLVYFLYRTEGYSAGLINFFSIYYLVLLLPTLYIHIEYYLRNRNDVLIINPAAETITINNRDPICFVEIETIVYVMPPVWHRKRGIRLLPFEDYHYAKIKMKNGDFFIFTCLMAYRVEDALKSIKGVPIEKNKLLLATTFIE